MILICGSGVQVDQLPLSDMMDYVVESARANIEIRLKSSAKGSSCFKVYIHDTLRDIPLVPIVEEKVQYFTSTEELISILDSYSTVVSTTDTVVEEVSIKDEALFAEDFSNVLVETKSDIYIDSKLATNTLPISTSESTDNSVDSKDTDISDNDQTAEVDVSEAVEIVEESLMQVNTAVFASMLDLEGIDSDVDNLTMQLKGKQKIIEQKDSMIKELTDTREELYALQHDQFLEMKKDFESVIDNANATIAALENKLSATASISPDLQKFMKYDVFARVQNCRTVLRDTFQDSELQKINKATSKLFIFASGAGDSLYSMLVQVKGLIDANADFVIADFSNDVFLSTRYRFQPPEEHSLMLGDKLVASLVKKLNNVDLIPTTSYNDIALLRIDWLTVISNLLDYANGRPVILLFNNINSFSVRCTVSKLATIGRLFIFAKCFPAVLFNLAHELCFIPENRFVLVALEYIDVFKEMLLGMKKKYSINAFAGDIDWIKLGIKR